MADKKPNKQVHLLPKVNQMLVDIVFQRTKNEEPNATKQAVVAELITKQHKKEIK